MRPYKGDEGPRDSLKVPATSFVDTGYSPPLSSNGHIEGLTNLHLMEERYSTGESTRARSPPFQAYFQRPETRSHLRLTVPTTARTLPQEFDAYLKLQDETTLLRVQLQQKRKEALRARHELADAEAKIEQALRETSMAGYQISLETYQQLLEAADQARNTSGPLEQEVEDLDFRLVSEETRLIKDGLILQDLMSRLSRDQYSSNEVDPYPGVPPSPQTFEQGGSRRASTEIFYEDDTSIFDGPIYDADDPSTRNLVDQFAPDLAGENRTFSLEDPDRPEQIELYVPDFLEFRSSSTNPEECMGSELMDQFSMTHLLRTFFKSYDLHFRRWMLHFHHIRQSVQDMLYSHTLSAMAVMKMLKQYNDITHGYNGRTTTTSSPGSQTSEEERIASRPRFPSQGAETV